MSDPLRFDSGPGRWVITATVLGSGMAQLDSTVVGIALPRIGVDFGVGVSSLQWVVTAYSLTLSSFLLLGGSLGDRFGRRRIFQVGVVWFALASALCALAPDATILILSRALQGVGGALLTPGSLAILQASFAAEDRGRAIGSWSGLGGLASAAGPLVGGVLLAFASWRLLFIINLPLAAAVISISSRHVPESTDPTAKGRVDAGGAVAIVVALSALTFALIEGPDRGWSSAGIIAAIGLGVLALGSFVAVERRVANPMLPPGMFASRQFDITNVVTFMVYGALGGALFLLPVALEQVAGYAPLEAGVSLLPITLLMLLLSARSGKLAARIGPRLQMSIGPVVAGSGLALLMLLTVTHLYPIGVLPGVLCLGAGLVLTVAPLTATAMSSAPEAHAGLASAVNNDVARAAGLIAVAVVPVVSSLTGDAYLHPAAFAHGFRIATAICAVLAASGGVIAFFGIRNRPASADAGPPEQQHGCGQQGGPGLPAIAASRSASAALNVGPPQR